jgi:hypothetical protein
LSEPENALLGEMYAGQMSAPAPLRLTVGALPFLVGTELRAGSVLPGLIGLEYDHVFDNGLTPPALSVLATSPLSCYETCPSNGRDIANATLYTATSGARVFDAGTFQWGWGLDDARFDAEVPPAPHAYSNTGFQQFTVNLIAYLLGSPADEGLYAAA